MLELVTMELGQNGLPVLKLAPVDIRQDEKVIPVASPMWKSSGNAETQEFSTHGNEI